MNVWTERLRDAILDNSAWRRGLEDDEAQPLLDWGLAKANEVTTPLTTMPPEDAEARYDELYGALPKQMTRITWAATYREKKGEGWTRKTLNQLNELNQTLYGQAAPQIDQAWIDAYATHQDGGLLLVEILNALMTKLSSPSLLEETDQSQESDQQEEI